MNEKTNRAEVQKRPNPEDYRTQSTCIDQISLLRDMDKYIDCLESRLKELEGKHGALKNVLIDK